MTTYHGNKGSYTLEKAFNQGAEAQIYSIKNNPNLVAKVFKPASNTAFQEEKIKAMLAANVHKNLFDQVKWPIDILLDNNNKFVGYVMDNANTSMQLYQVNQKTDQFDYKKKLIIAHNLCSAVYAVHCSGHLAGDMNPRNIMIDPKSLKVHLIDTDSFVINTAKKAYRCPVGSDDYISRELFEKLINENQDLTKLQLPTYTVETDNFALAVNIFTILMDSYHPFTCRKLDTATSSFVFPRRIDNIINGYSPFLSTKAHLDIPKQAPRLSSLPKSIQDMFKTTFIDGHANPKKRPSAEEWRKVLEAEYLKVKGPKPGLLKRIKNFFIK